jgi:hypothetical protein
MPVTNRDLARVGRLTDELWEALQPFLDGTAADRDRLVQAHGVAFGRITVPVRAFCQNPDDREQTLRLAALIPWNE